MFDSQGVFIGQLGRYSLIRTKENPFSPKEVAIMLVLLCILIFPFAVLAELMKMNGK